MASENEMGRIAALVQRKRVLREGMSLFEQEQRERRAAQGIRNEKRRGDDDELEVIAKLDREIREQIHHRDTANATGIQPNRWPSAYEFNAGLRKIQYHELNFHIAIVGGTGYGKSSLINAFLNLGPNDASAAPVGFPETTLGIRRYPDPGTQPPRPCTVWYEISGASVSHWDYFAKQALFVFDSIILTIGDRFQETDCQIIRSCLQFNIPCFLVRSKADWHIWNMMRDEDEGYQGPFNNGTLYQKCRQSFMDISQKMVTEELKRANLPDQVVYCVSNRVLRVVYKGFLEQSVVLDGDSHELALVKVLVKSINQRRGGSQGAWGKHTTFMQNPGISDTAKPETPIRTTRSIGTNTISQMKPKIAVRRVLYLPNPTTIHELQIELVIQNPGLISLFLSDPQMLSPKVALLSFDPDASIPARISAFRRSQQPKMYVETSE